MIDYRKIFCCNDPQSTWRHIQTFASIFTQVPTSPFRHYEKLVKSFLLISSHFYRQNRLEKNVMILSDCPNQISGPTHSYVRVAFDSRC